MEIENSVKWKFQNLLVKSVLLKYLYHTCLDLKFVVLHNLLMHF